MGGFPRLSDHPMNKPDPHPSNPQIAEDLRGPQPDEPQLIERSQPTPPQLAREHAPFGAAVLCSELAAQAE